MGTGLPQNEESEFRFVCTKTNWTKQLFREIQNENKSDETQTKRDETAFCDETRENRRTKRAKYSENDFI